MLTKEITQEAAANVIRLNGEIAALTGRKASTEALITGQCAVFHAASAFLKRESAVKADAARLNDLRERERRLVMLALRDNPDALSEYMEIESQLQRANFVTAEESRLTLERERRFTAKARIDALTGEADALDAEIREANAARLDAEIRGGLVA